MSRCRIIAARCAIVALTALCWITSYSQPSDTRYTGWWHYYQMRDRSWIGMTCFDGKFLAWRFRCRRGRRWLRKTSFQFGPFGYINSSDKCMLEGQWGIPWDAHHAPVTGRAEAGWFPVWVPLLVLLHPLIRMLVVGISCRRRRRCGLCTRDGYNLAGNVSGVCAGVWLPARNDVQSLQCRSPSAKYRSSSST